MLYFIRNETKKVVNRMKIGGVEICGYASLAPLAGVADRAFREICAEFGASMFTTEMVSAKGLIYGDRKSEELMFLTQKERPAGIQLFCSSPEDVAKAIPLTEKFGPDFIDINMGCPAPKVTKNGCGSALLRDPELCGRIVAAAVKVSPVPVTVKIRKGWDAQHPTAVETARICAENGAAAITVHGRTREQMYAPPTDLDVIRQVREAVSVPVIGNGDVTDGASAEHMYRVTDCDLVAVGRGALGSPWIFAGINAYMKGETYQAPDIGERMAIMLRHAAKICEYKGERIGINETRKHAIWYTKGLRGKAELRRRMSEITNLAQLENIAAEIVEMNR